MITVTLTVLPYDEETEKLGAAAAGWTTALDYPDADGRVVDIDGRIVAAGEALRAEEGTVIRIRYVAGDGRLVEIRGDGIAKTIRARS